MKKAILAALAALVLLASSALAQEKHPVKPLLSLSRLSLGAGADYVVYQPRLGEVDPDRCEWEGAVLAAYSVVPHLALTASSRYGLDSGRLQYRAGVRLHLWGGD